MDRLESAAEIACLGIIGVLGFKESPKLFAIGALPGAAWGAYKILKAPHQHEHCDTHGCGVGFYERLAGASMPKSLALAAGTAIIVTHIRHHLLHVCNPFVILAGWTVACRGSVEICKFGKSQCHNPA